MEYFSFFLSYFEAAEDLTNEDFGKYVRSLCEYAFHDKEDTVLKGVTKALYKMAIPIINKKKEMPKGGRPKLLTAEDVAKIAEKSKGGVSQTELAREFGVSQKTISNAITRSLVNTSNYSENTEKILVETDRIGMDMEKEEDKEEEKERKFRPPTLDEVRYYCQAIRKNKVDWQKFFDYYNENKWKDNNGNPVKNWKGKIIAVWEPKNREPQSELDSRNGLDGIDDDCPF